MRPFYRSLLPVLILLLTFYTCKGQSYYFMHYQVDDGLAHNTIITLIQDSKGFMWIGTKDGLNRFDGYTFKTFKNDQNKFGKIGNNIIVSICEDRKGMIWVGTGKGIFKYDPYLELFRELNLPIVAAVTHINADHKNNLWFLANGKLQYFDQEKNKVTNTGLTATCLAVDRFRNVWMGRSDGTIQKYVPQTKSLTTIQIIDKDLPDILKFITKLLPTDDSTILIGTSKLGAKYYTIKTGTVKSLILGNKENTDIYVRDIIASGKREYWIATESGIYTYNFNSGTSRNLKKINGDNYSITDNAVYSLCKDKQGGLWAGTFFGGLNYYSSENARFKKYYQVNGLNSIAGNAIREISSDNNNNIWIGTEDAGINKLNTKTGTFYNYTPTGQASNLSYTNIHGLLAFNDQLFIGPFIRGLEIMDIKTGLITERFKLIGVNSNKVSDFVMCIYLTADKTLLIGTTGHGQGLFSFDLKKKVFSKFGVLPNNFNVYAILEDHEGTIWVGSPDRGTFHFNQRNGTKGNISFSEKNDSPSNVDFLIQGIFEDSQHSLWFATEGGGLIKLGADRKTVKKYTTENGLPSNTIFRMLEDSNNNLWVSSLKGLICLSLKTDKIKVYTKSNGLITDQFNYNSAYKAPNGEMFFGTVKGMISFNPAQFNQSHVSIPTYFTGFQINNKDVVPSKTNSPLKKSILYTDTILLAHDQSNFNIEFAAINYSSPKVTRFKYYMKGLDKDWTYLNSNRKAYFTDLSPGNYTFILQAESNEGSWISTERRLFIRISPPLWKSNTAFLFYILVTSIALYLSFRYYHLYLQKKNLNKLRMFEYEKEKEIYQAKIEFFTNITHEIQTPLTLIAGPVELIMKKINELPAIKRSLLMIDQNTNRLLELTNQLLDFRKTELNQFGLNFVNVDIIDILKSQLVVFRQMADKSKITLIYDLPSMPIIAFVDKEAFLKISSNLISNAIKYANSTATISIAPFRPDDLYFTIRFNNDGNIISEEFREKIFNPFFRIPGNKKPGTGIGLSLAKSLTDLHNGSLRLISKEPNSTLFELTLPIHQKFEFKISTWKKMD